MEPSPQPPGQPLPQPSVGPAVPPQVQLASIGARFVAVFIEGALIGLLLGMAITFGMADPEVAGLATVFAWVTVIGLTVYNLWLFRRGKSIGKLVLGLTVVDQEGGQPIGFLRMFLREWIGRWISGLLFGLGYLWAIWDDRRQAWHDKIFSTLVARDRSPSDRRITRV